MNFIYFLIETYRMDKYKSNAWYKSINTRIKKEKAKFTLNIYFKKKCHYNILSSSWYSVTLTFQN